MDAAIHELRLKKIKISKICQVKRNALNQVWILCLDVYTHKKINNILVFDFFGVQMKLLARYM